MSILTLATKDLRLLLRDARSAIILLVMPLMFVAVLGISLGEGFGQKPDDSLRISIVNEDEGLPEGSGTYPPKRWSEVVIDDLAGAGNIRIEMIGSRQQAMELIHNTKRAAVLIFEKDFSRRMHACSFLSKEMYPQAINPMYRDGINVTILGLTIARDETQRTAASIIEQVAQVTLFRTVLPWMIGNAFARVGDREFMAVMEQKLGHRPDIPGPVLKDLDPVLRKLLDKMFKDPKFKALLKEKFGFLAAGFEGQLPKFQEILREAFQDEEFLKRLGKDISLGEVMKSNLQEELGPVVQDQIADLFRNYNFRAKTWAGLTLSDERETSAQRDVYHPEEGFLKRGSLRYQLLVPSYTVMFAFFLVLTVGWLFVAERRQGTLVRLRAAPLTRTQILAGKLIPCLIVSLFQGFFLLIAGKWLFGMSWGPQAMWLIPLVVATSLAAMGMAMLIAGVARTETQVAIYGTLLVLTLAGISGAFMPRYLMPDAMRELSYLTPHAWALDAYLQLLTVAVPNTALVAQCCGVLALFGIGFLGLAWWFTKLD